MYLATYDRLNVPDDIDNSNFGTELPSVRLSGAGYDKNIVLKYRKLPSLNCKQSKAYGYAEFPYQLTQCNVHFSVGYTKEIKGTIFLPDHAVIVSQTGRPNVVVAESLWHSHLFFIPWFRNDHTTNWKWREDIGYTPDVIFSEPVNYCYHRFHDSNFHWFMDVMPQVWYLSKHSPYGKGRKWFCGPIDTSFKAECLRAYGIKDEDLLAVEAGIVSFESMAMAGFSFEEPLKTRPSFDTGLHHKGWSKEFVYDLRETMLRHFNIVGAKPHKKYYLSRADATHRKITNEEEVLNLLMSHGFEVIVPGNLSFQEQVQAFSNADVIIGAHGAGFTNILWAPSGASIVELMPEKLTDIGYRFTANMLNQKHYAISCEQFEHHFGDAFSDIHVDMALLRQALKGIL